MKVVKDKIKYIIALIIIIFIILYTLMLRYNWGGSHLYQVIEALLLSTIPSVIIYYFTYQDSNKTGVAENPKNSENTLQDLEIISKLFNIIEIRGDKDSEQDKEISYRINKVIEVTKNKDFEDTKYKVFEDTKYEVSVKTKKKAKRSSERYVSRMRDDILTQECKHFDNAWLNKRNRPAINYIYNIIILTNLIRKYPQGEQLYRLLGFYKQEVRDNRGAIDAFTEAIRINPHYAKTYWERGLSKLYLGDYCGAISDCSKAIEIEPSIVFYLCRAGAKMKLGDIKGAKLDANLAIELKKSRVQR